MSEAEYLDWFRRTWEPANVRDLLGTAGAVLTAYELLKKRVVDDLLGFYVIGFDESGFTYSERYDAEVLSLHASSHYLASCAWLVEAGALTEEQVSVLSELHEVRGRMTHELVAYLVDPAYEVRGELLADAREALRALVVFWGRLEVEASGDYDGQVVADEDITAGDLLIFDQLISAVALNERDRTGNVADDAQGAEAAPGTSSTTQ